MGIAKTNNGYCKELEEKVIKYSKNIATKLAVVNLQIQ
jgi:hypothetical protein